MGLQIVELIMEIEDEFSVGIPDSELALVATLGDLHEVVLRRLGLQADVCPTSRAFYRLRAALVATTGCERKEVRPDTPLERLLPLPGRRRRWKALEGAGLPYLPPLGRPKAVVITIATAGLAVTARMLSALLHGVPITAEVSVSALGLSAMVAVLFAATLWLLTEGLANRFPAGAVRLGDLVHQITPASGSTPCPASSPVDIDPALTWARVVKVVSRSIRVPAETLTPSSSLRHDLGL